MPVSFTNEPDTKEVVINHKRFHFTVDYDAIDLLCGIRSVHLTECGDSDEIEMLEAYDMYQTD